MAVRTFGKSEGFSATLWISYAHFSSYLLYISRPVPARASLLPVPPALKHLPLIR
ncbi:hypothetical protein PENSPDRAFT_660106, partial [Peniophora sp. CONT]